jgi:hypothetical protein
MSGNAPPPTVLLMLERHLGRKIHVILDQSYGYEGILTAVSRDPPGLWLSDGKATVLRSTIAQPIPQVVSREDRSEVFINLTSVQRLEVLHED